MQNSQVLLQEVHMHVMKPILLLFFVQKDKSFRKSRHILEKPIY